MKVLVIGHDGIGNMIQTIPLIKQCIEEGYEVSFHPKGWHNNYNTVFDKWQEVNVVKSPNTKEYDSVFYAVNTHKAKDRNGKPLLFKDSFKVGEASLNCMNMGYDKSYDLTAPLHSSKDYSEFSDKVIIWAGCKSNWPAKRWPYYGELMDLIKDPVLVGQKEHSTISYKPNHCIDMEDKIPYLPDLTALIRAAKGFIGNDGGISHLSATTGTPTYIIFGPTSVVKNRARGDHVHILRKGLACSPCQSKSRGMKCPKYKTAKCMHEFTADDVVEQLPKEWLK